MSTGSRTAAKVADPSAVAARPARAGAPLAVLLRSSGLLLLLASVAVAVTIGPARISVPDVWSTVAAHLGFGASDLSPIRDGIIWNLRMPRTLLAAVCGAGLAVCGTVMQSLLRNPLADPFVLGVSSGASTGAVVVVVLGVGGGAGVAVGRGVRRCAPL
ncbi:iron complex transport system permease protein, partial [Streptomyces sp. Termitarium-T10T-6]